MANKFDFDFKMTDRGLDALKRELAAVGAGKSYTKAGILGKTAERDPVSGAAQEPASNVDIAIANEFGTDTIPERSFMRASFDNNTMKYIDQFARGARAIYDGKAGVKQILDMLGMQAASDMRNLIRSGSGVPPPNAPATIARKGSSHTLVDTGQMINSVSNETVMGSGTDPTN